MFWCVYTISTVKVHDIFTDCSRHYWVFTLTHLSGKATDLRSTFPSTDHQRVFFSSNATRVFLWRQLGVKNLPPNTWISTGIMLRMKKAHQYLLWNNTMLLLLSQESWPRRCTIAQMLPTFFAHFTSKGMAQYGGNNVWENWTDFISVEFYTCWSFRVQRYVIFTTCEDWETTGCSSPTNTLYQLGKLRRAILIYTRNVVFVCLCVSSNSTGLSSRLPLGVWILNRPLSNYFLVIPQLKIWQFSY